MRGDVRIEVHERQTKPVPSFDLVTGEAVALDLRPAALPSRLVAGAIDALLQGALLGALAVVAVASGTSTSSAGEAAITLVVLLAVLAGYPIAFETLLRGRTPGKAVMGLRVVRDDGGPIGFRQALVRGLTSAFVERPGITVFTGAVVCMLLNDRSKRIGDLLAGTVVLQERVSTSAGPGTAAPPQLAAWAGELDLAGLPDDLALSARAYLARAGELTDAARDDLGGRLASAVAAVVTPPPPQGAPAWAYLAAVLAERSRRATVNLAAPSAIRPPVSRPPVSRPPVPLAHVDRAPVEIPAGRAGPPPPPQSTTGFAPPG